MSEFRVIQTCSVCHKRLAIFGVPEIVKHQNQSMDMTMVVYPCSACINEAAENKAKRLVERALKQAIESECAEGK